MLQYAVAHLSSKNQKPEFRKLVRSEETQKESKWNWRD